MGLKDMGLKSPAEKVASTMTSEYDLSNHGITNTRTIYWNLSQSSLYEEVMFRQEGKLAYMGPLIVKTGKHTARAAGDKFVVKEPENEDKIWWGEYNRPMPESKFNALVNRIQAYLQNRDVFVFDGIVGADPNYSMPIRIITEYAWHNLFARNMFITINNQEKLRNHIPEFTIICVPDFKASPEIDGTNSGTFIILNFAQKLGIIGGSAYAGEIKKSVFTVMNYLMPLQGIMSMHCSANVGKDNNSALFFGLSGTGKTTLSADPERSLVGDDEHGWSDDGVFNYEGGCYAKVIQLSPSAEPEIYACTRKYGTLLENVICDPVTRLVDLDDDHITENTRASYPLEFIENVYQKKSAGHPNNIILLTCDANGVLPPISKLTPDQAIYHFISGYTSKIAGTEVGLGREPEPTFSACFGAPFMVHHPYYYANLLMKKVLEHNADVWFVNTGWSGGQFGVGQRTSIKYTRAMLNAVLDGKLKDVEYYNDPLFGLNVPKSCEGVPEKVLNPESTWGDSKAYWQKYKYLASLFIENFKKYQNGCPPEVLKAGPDLSKAPK
ncbi:MAG: Phosphoenolpyruvate carboxykinase [ATP] [Candidatus Heimdallarchaeota archaeon LC_3]|nr:MAG: Phosphoenolpyruvate carboxykinase [ATP] [Candidatus Heimdallarchaeota archaeon LC_3]